MLAMKKNKIIQFLLILYITLLSFNKYFQIFSLPISMYVMAILVIAVLIIYKKISRFDVFTILWIAIALISVVIDNNLENTKAFLSLLINISSYFIIFNLIKNNKYYIKDCFTGVKISTIILSFVAIYEIITKEHLMSLSIDYARRFFGVPVAFYVNANDLATTLVSLIIILSIEFIYNKEHNLFLGKLFNIFLITISSIIIFYTNSTICFASVLTIIILYFLLKKYFSSKNKSILFLAVLVFILLMIGTLYFTGSYILNIDSISSRIVIWKNAIQLLNNHLLLGIGPGQSEVLGVGQIHFLLLEILISYGIIIFLIFIIKYIKEIKVAKKNINESYNNYLKNINIMIYVFYLLLLVLSICSSSMTKLYLVWVCIAICISIANCKEEF